MNCPLAGSLSSGHFIAIVLHPDWTSIAWLLLVNLYFYMFNLPAGRQVSSGSWLTQQLSQPCTKPCPLCANTQIRSIECNFHAFLTYYFHKL